MWYNNETEEYEFSDWLSDPKCGWYRDNEGLLYIIAPYAVAEDSYGPDNSTLVALIEHQREDSTHSRSFLRKHKLTAVPHSLRRWSEQDGVYTA